jgi:hypothetical protein
VQRWGSDESWATVEYDISNGGQQVLRDREERRAAMDHVRVLLPSATVKLELIEEAGVASSRPEPPTT